MDRAGVGWGGITILLMSVELGGTIHFCQGAPFSAWCWENLPFIALLLNL